jgi:hypothetical protein
MFYFTTYDVKVHENSTAQHGIQVSRCCILLMTLSFVESNDPQQEDANARLKPSPNKTSA